ncbi:hypothetical protein NBH07_15445 [Parabacteroides sp. B2-S-102]|uniref:hypothetical protein n=1 Tax=Parabacteroides sp. B2-S-102 TaxID=2949657 RepID=UPI0020301C0C|nr:hypothetical protein [Parabacteroides sp. B2-S-102]MCM0696282.1 hypothetical protein [Parabacteroides sp. B2-S-102]
MNKRHYEHTLPNIRGSLSNTYEGGYRTVTSEHFQSGLGGGEAPSGLPGHLHQPF